MSSNITTIEEPTTDIRSYSFMIPFIIQTIFNTFIFVAGLIGNIFVIVIILRRKKMQTITNWFVFNLAISNICIVMLTIPLGFLMPLISWPFGKIGCVIIIPILEHFAGVCVLTHTAVSLVRCLIVISAISGYKITTTVVRNIIILIWVTAFTLMSLPLMTGFIGWMETEKRVDNSTACNLIWVSPEKKLTFFIYIFFLTYITPMIITGISYVWIHVAVSKNIKHLYGHMSEQIITTRRRKSRHMNRIFMMMYILFAISTLPLQVFYLCSAFGGLPDKFGQSSFGENLIFGMQALFYTQVVWNPLVLFFMGEEYRKEIYNLPLCRCLNSNHRNISYVIRGSYRGVLKVYRKRKSIDNQRRRSSAKNSTKKSLTDRIAPRSKNSTVYNNLAQVQNVSENKVNLYIAQHLSLPLQISDTPGSQDVQPFSTERECNSISLEARNSNLNETSLRYTSTLYCSSNIRPTTDNILEIPKTCILSKELCPENFATNLSTDVSETTSIFDAEFLSLNNRDLNNALIYKPTSETSLISSHFINTNDNISTGAGTIPCENIKDSELEKYSNKLPSVYYDDGKLTFFHDSTFGKYYLQFDDGRETDL